MVYTSIAMLVAGLAALAFTSKYTIRYSIDISHSLALGRFAIGFIFISLTTSFPELFVAISSGVHGEAGMGVGNILGSVFANLSIVLGMAVLIGGALVLHEDDLGELIEMLFISSIVALFVLQRDSLTILQGVILLVLGVVFLKRSAEEKIPMEHEPDFLMFAQSSMKFILSIGALVLSSELVVRGALGAIQVFDVTPEFVGLTVLSIGTSIPELAVGVQAIREGEFALALGDIMGSSIINLTLVMGLLSLANPIPINLLPVSGIMPFIILSVLSVWYLISKGKDITHRWAVYFIALYALFVVEQIGILTLFS